MSETPPQDESPVTLMEEAALWFARMRGPEADDHRPLFEAWLARGALHRQAYNRAAEIFSMGKLLSQQDAEGQPQSSARRADRRLAAIAGMTGAVLLLGVVTDGIVRFDTDVGHVSVRQPNPPAVLELATAGTEQRMQQLADGSIVTLGPASQLRVRFTADGRNLTLVRGRARFEVAHERRPFVVLASGATVTALGTIFEVQLGTRRKVKVALLEGSVEIARPQGISGPSMTRRLRPGQSLVFAALSDTLPQAPSDPAAGALQDRVTTDRAIVHDFEGVRLADVIAQANRTATRPILLADASLAELRLSGRFDLSDTVKLAEKTGAVFSLRVDQSDPAKIVLALR